MLQYTTLRSYYLQSIVVPCTSALLHYRTTVYYSSIIDLDVVFDLSRQVIQNDGHQPTLSATTQEEEGQSQLYFLLRIYDNWQTTSVAMIRLLFALKLPLPADASLQAHLPK